MRFSEEYFAEHMKGITGSAIRDIFKLLGKPGMISFAGELDRRDAGDGADLRLAQRDRQPLQLRLLHGRRAPVFRQRI